MTRETAVAHASNKVLVPGRADLRGARRSACPALPRGPEARHGAQASLPDARQRRVAPAHLPLARSRGKMQGELVAAGGGPGKAGALRQGFRVFVQDEREAASRHGIHVDRERGRGQRGRHRRTSARCLPQTLAPPGEGAPVRQGGVLRPRDVHPHAPGAWRHAGCPRLVGRGSRRNARTCQSWPRSTNDARSSRYRLLCRGCDRRVRGGAGCFRGRREGQRQHRG